MRYPNIQWGPAEFFLDSLWATLLYSHQVAIIDPFVNHDAPRHDDDQNIDRTKRILHLLAVLAPLVDDGTVQLIATDMLPTVKLDFSALANRLNGPRAVIWSR